MGVGKDDSGSEVSPMAVEKDSADGEASPEINKHKDPMSIDQNPVLCMFQFLLTVVNGGKT